MKMCLLIPASENTVHKVHDSFYLSVSVFFYVLTLLFPPALSSSGICAQSLDRENVFALTDAALTDLESLRRSSLRAVIKSPSSFPFSLKHILARSIPNPHWSAWCSLLVWKWMQSTHMDARRSTHPRFGISRGLCFPFSFFFQGVHGRDIYEEAKAKK